MSSFCPFCGKQLVDGASFCVGCGKPAVNSASLPTQSSVNANIQPPSTQSSQMTTTSNSQLFVGNPPNYTNQQYAPQTAYQQQNSQSPYVTPYKPHEITLLGMIFDYFFGGFSGRCGVLELWLTGFLIGFLQLILFGVPCTIAFFLLKDNPTFIQYLQIIIYVVSGLWSLINFLPSIMLTCRRLHDLDWSGWAQLILYIPIANIFFLIYILFFPGTNGRNRFD